jgi:hypothetical protein
MPFTDLTGKTFGRLSVLSRTDNEPSGGVRWLCKCDCGNIKKVKGQNLRERRIISCGCWKAELQAKLVAQRSIDHGHARRGTHTKAYDAWVNMKQRCSNPRVDNYPQYGGRGICVCARWLNSFAHFLADMGDPPSPIHSLDRRNNDGNYEPGNCRWAIVEVQANNKAASRIIEFNSRSLSLQQWSRATGIAKNTIKNRIDRLGWSVSEALSAPPSPIGRAHRSSSATEK